MPSGSSPRAKFPVPDYAFPAPDTYYGVAKVAGEALAALYHHRYGLETICVRILTCADRPPTVRALSTWLSPDDAGRLFESCLSAPRPGFRVIFGVSANTRGGWVSLEAARSLGYEPEDDAEAYAAEVIARAARLIRLIRCWPISAASSACLPWTPRCPDLSCSPRRAPACLACAASRGRLT